jgi:predicted nucleotidyltransferase
MKNLTKEYKDIKKEDVIRIYEDLLKKVADGVRRCFGKNLVSVVLYGSLARGEVKKDSDIDLLIIFEDLPKERLKRQDIFMKMESDVDEEIKRIYEKWRCYPYISPILKTREEAKILSPLYLDMVTDARILYDKADFFKGILEKLRMELNSLHAKRKRVGKKWYWDLKPDYRLGEEIRIE